MSDRAIVWGVCGIGNGHLCRQLPLIERFAENARIAIMSSGDTYASLSKRFAGHENIRVIEALVPFYPGAASGIDWAAVPNRPENQGKDFDASRAAALAAAEAFLGIADFVISDYEPTAAAYAYAHAIPLITIDQQSKYLAGDFPSELGGFGFKDEVERLSFFFLHAVNRIVCSFFTFPLRVGGEQVTLIPPILKDSVASASPDRARDAGHFLVYLSGARPFGQAPQEILSVLGSHSTTTFHLFVPASVRGEYQNAPVNVHLYEHGDAAFERVLLGAEGIISTAGHSLLSEAMHLQIPVYAIPVAPYEQYMNAQVIEDNGFGVSAPQLDSATLENFIQNCPAYREAIASDTSVLLRGSGTEAAIHLLKQMPA